MNWRLRPGLEEPPDDERECVRTIAGRWALAGMVVDSVEGGRDEVGGAADHC